MKSFTLCLLVLFTLSGIGCSSSKLSNKSDVHHTSLFVDKTFPNYQSYTLETEQEVFELDDEIKRFVNENLKGIKEPDKRIKKLVKYLFSREYIDLSYKADANLTAAQAFHSRTANCLSLTIMAYSLASYAELDVTFKQVDVPEYWMRSGSYNTLTGHVNLEVKAKKPLNVPIFLVQKATKIDFDPSVSSQNFSSKDISKQTILAMFYNNKGGEALVAGNLELAYAYFRKSAVTDPTFSSTWSNLGVLYRLNNLLNKAMDAYRYAILVDDENFTAHRNLALTLALLGQNDLAEEITSKIHRKRLKNPYYLVMLGDEAYFSGNFITAITYYRRAMKMEPTIHEIYYGLSKAYYALDDVQQAEESIQMAIRHSNLNSVNQEYSAKLNWIRDRR